MRFRNYLLMVLALASLALGGCGGSGGDGLNGSITLDSASATGAVVTASATYTNPQKTDLIGQPITFTYRMNYGPEILIGTFNTNNSGSIQVTFKPTAFVGSQTITVIAKADKLTDTKTFTMTGRSVAVTAPATVASVAAATTVDVPISIPVSPNFITVTDPFVTTLSGTAFKITLATNTSASDGSATTNDKVVLTANITNTASNGIASFPGATATITAATTVGAVKTMTITWTVTEVDSSNNPIPGGLVGTGITTVTLTSI